MRTTEGRLRNTEGKLLQLVEEFLRQRGWSIRSGSHISSICIAPPGVEQAVQLGFLDTDAVQLVNDACEHVAASLKLEDIARALVSGSTPCGQLAIGRGLLFTGEANSISARVSGYPDALREEFDWPHREALAAASERVTFDCVGYDNSGGEIKSKHEDFSAKKIVSQVVLANERRIGERALIALQAFCDPSAVALHLVTRHAEAFRNDADVLCRVPILVPAEEIRTRGYIEAVAGRAALALDQAFERTQIEVMLQGGFLHPYVVQVEKVRLAYDLDPNSTHIADIFVSAGESGSFTLLCAREHVFQEPLLLGPKAQPAAARPSLCPMGQRFWEAPDLVLYDTKKPAAAAFVNLRSALDRACTTSVLQIARLADGRLTQPEAERCLLHFALAEWDANGGSVPVSELDALIRGVVRDARARQSNIDAIREAMISCGAVREFDENSLGMNAKSLGAWLIARTLSESLNHFEQLGDTQTLHRILATRNLPYWVMRWAIDAMDRPIDKDVGGVATRQLASRYLTRSPREDDIVAAENILTLLFAAMSAALANPVAKINDLDQALNAVNGDASRVLSRLALPQRAFVGGADKGQALRLLEWRFEDCDLRNALFRNCDLTGAKFIDCQLAGALFLNCQVDEVTQFSRSDLSGAFVEGGTGWSSLEADAFTGANLTSAEMRVEGAQRLFSSIQASGAATTLLTLRDVSGSAPIEDSAAAGEFFTGLASAAWAEGGNLGAPAVIVRTGTNELTVVNPVQHFSPDSNQWPYATPVIAAAADQAVSHRFLIVADAAGGRYAGDAGRGATYKWQKLGAVADGDGAPLLAAINNAGESYFAFNSRDQIELHRGSGDVQSIPFPGSCHHATALILVPPIEDERSVSAVAGFEDGQVLVDTQDLNLGAGAAVLALGATVRGDVVFAVHADGLVTGIRRSAHASPSVAFRFHTPLVHVLSIAPLNATGQVAIVGMTTAGAKQPEGNRVTLCYVVSASGHVAAVFPRLAPRREFPFAGYRLPEGVGATENLQPDMTSEVSQALRALDVKTAKLYVRPYASSAASIELQYPRRELGMILPDALLYPEGLRHRYFELTLKEFDAEHRMLLQRTLLESDLEISSGFHPTVSFSHRYARKTRTALAQLIVGYVGAEAATRVLDIDIEVEWEGNPFTANGMPVVDDRFFGMRQQLKQLLTTVREKEWAIVTSRRRAGKTSFLLRAADYLTGRKAESELYEASEPRPASFGEPLVAINITAEGSGKDAKSFIQSVAAALQRFETTRADGKYRGLSAILEGESSLESLRRLGEAAAGRGIPLPIVILVDEWGLYRDQASNHEFLRGITSHDGLKNAGISIVAASVPDDFPLEESSAGSGLDRYVKLQLDLGPWPDHDIFVLMDRPLDQIKWSMEPQLREIIRRMASGVPDDANRLMHEALKCAMSEFKAEIIKRRVIETRHLDLHVAQDILVTKYRKQQEFLQGRLTPENFHELHKSALMDPPRWEQEEMSVPEPGQADPHQREVFAGAGYRRPAASRSGWRIWMPYGLALYYRTTGGGAEV